MKFNVSDGEQYQKVMEVTVPVEEMELALKNASKRIAGKVNIPGFRKGKAPQSIVENFVGIDSILQEAADDLLPQAYFAGIKENDLEPVEQPKIEMVTLAKGEPMVFKATFTVKPEVKLGDYKGLKVTKQVVKVGEEAVEAELAAQQQRTARMVDAEEGAAAAEKDTVTLDFEGFKDGVPFEGGKAEDYPLELGSGSFIPGFEEQLVGLRVGETKDLEVTFPEEYQEASLAGQPVVFKVEIKGIKHRVLPELDDAFAQEVSETADTLEALKAEIRTRLEERNQAAATDAAREQALQQAVENSTIDVPPLMTEQRLDNIVYNMADRLRSQGLEMEQFLQYAGQTAQEFRESYRGQAEANVQSDLVLEAVAKAENISVSPEELEQQLQQLAASYWQSVEQIREALQKNGQMESIIESIQLQKAVDLIYDNAEVSEELVDEPAPAVEAPPEEEKKPAKKKAPAKKTTKKAKEEAAEAEAAPAEEAAKEEPAAE